MDNNSVIVCKICLDVLSQKWKRHFPSESKVTVWSAAAMQ